MQTAVPSRPRTALRAAAIALSAYGAITVFLQLETPLKLARGAMGYGGWAWGGFSDMPGAWGAPTAVDDPAQALYSALTLRQPLLPWIALSAGLLLLLRLGAAPTQLSEKAAVVETTQPVAAA